MRIVQVDVLFRIILKIDERVCVVGNYVLNVFNFDFEFINKIDLFDCLDGVVIDVYGNIIYLCCYNYMVKKMNNSNKVMFIYRYWNLCLFLSFVVDLVGNIYVCGCDSDNIYVILEIGKIIKIQMGLNVFSVQYLKKIVLCFLLLQKRVM